MALSSTDRPEALPASARITLIGAGALGQALALRLSEKGLPPTVILSRTAARAAALAARVGATPGTNPVDELVRDADVIICCVPDAALPEIDQALALARRHWTGALVLHTSGALPAAIFTETARAGAWTASLHPIQTFARGADASTFDGIAAGIEGAEPGFELAWQLALRLGVHPLRVETHLKGTYHLACALASNYLTTLLHVAAEALLPLGIAPGDAQHVLTPLVDRALDAIRRTSPGEALTGPLVRGDVGTLDIHLAAITRHVPEFRALYLQLAEATRDMALAAGRLSDPQQLALASWLERHATRQTSDRGLGDPDAGSGRTSAGPSPH